jgi:transcriptional regulator with XRE-family HTH domain
VARRFDPQPELGAAIRELRLAKRLTQARLAELADLEPTWISRLEQGRANPSYGTVRRLAAALDESVSTLAARAEANERKRSRR